MNLLGPLLRPSFEVEVVVVSVEVDRAGVEEDEEAMQYENT